MCFLFFSRPISLYLFPVFAFAFFTLSRNFRLHTLRLLSHPLSCIININRVRVAAIILPSIETFLVCFAVVKRFAENKKTYSKCNHIITTVLEREKIVCFFSTIIFALLVSAKPNNLIIHFLLLQLHWFCFGFYQFFVHQCCRLK